MIAPPDRVVVLGAGNWDYTTALPWWGYCLIGGMDAFTDPCDNEVAAIETFLSVWMPPIVNSRIALVDNRGVVVFGYATADHGPPHWFGCRAGFSAAEKAPSADTLELALWEAQARDFTDMEGWWKDG